MTGHDVDERIRQLARSWVRQSAGERADLVQSPEPWRPSTARAESLNVVRSRGALSGAVAPRDLVKGVRSDEADSLLDEVAKEFDRSLIDGQWAWTLRTWPRKEVLARLAAQGEVDAALDDVAEISTDDAGRILRQLARTRPRRSRTLFRRLAREKHDDAAVLQALTWAAPLGGGMGDLAEARRQASLSAIRESYESLVRKGVHGRRRELERLREFVAAPSDPSGLLPLLAVTGIGGAGKSTLLAALVGPFLDRLMAGDPTAPAVIVIDFDRVLFRVNSGVELSFEVTRQLGWAAPVASADFSVLRHQTREQRRQTQSDVATSPDEGDVRTASGFEREAAILVKMHELEHRPVVLVLDTFEEWQRDRPNVNLPRGERRNNPEYRIQEWIWRLRNAMNLRGLRVIVSGRASMSAMDGVRALPPLRLGELDREAALQVIGGFGVDHRGASVLADLVGGNPLALQVAALFYRNLPRRERRRFVATAQETHEDLAEELRSAVLYDRFLDHIQDEEVRCLAHPGLVLRRVTPSLVRYVLAPYCRFDRIGIDGIDESMASRLVERLGDEVWLVKSTPDGLWHHPDVRRTMLHMMADDPDHAESVRKIHRAAADWYQSGRDPELKPEAAKAEALYHLLMLETGERSITSVPGLGDGAETWARRATTAGLVADLHPRVRAQVMALRAEELTEQDAVELPRDIWDTWIASFGARLLSDGLGERALQFVEDRLRQRSDVEEPNWLAQAYCETARWRQYWSTVRWLDRQSARSNFEYRAGRYALINALASRDPLDLEEYDLNLVGHDVVGEPFFSLLRGSDPLGNSWAGTRWRHQVDLYPVDQFRRGITSLLAARSQQPFGFEKLASLFRPDPAWVRRWTRLIGLDVPTSFVDQLTDLAGQGRSDELLGEWSARFARVWRDEAVLSIEGIMRSPELVHALRGDNPELRPAIRLAVGAVADRYGVRSAGEIASGLLPIPVRDLRPDALPRRGSAERKAVFQLVEYVDRSGVTRAFLSAVRTAHPEMGLVRDVAEAFNAWDDAHDQLLRTLAANVSSSR